LLNQLTPHFVVLSDVSLKLLTSVSVWRYRMSTPKKTSEAFQPSILILEDEISVSKQIASHLNCMGLRLS